MLTGEIFKYHTDVGEEEQDIQNEILQELTSKLQHQEAEWLTHTENMPKIYIGLAVGRKM